MISYGPRCDLRLLLPRMRDASLATDGFSATLSTRGIQCFPPRTEINSKFNETESNGAVQDRKRGATDADAGGKREGVGE